MSKDPIPVTRYVVAKYFGCTMEDLPAVLEELAERPNPMFSGPQDPAQRSPLDLPEPMPASKPPVNPYSVPGGPKTSDPVEIAIPPPRRYVPEQRPPMPLQAPPLHETYPPGVPKRRK